MCPVLCSAGASTRSASVHRRIQATGSLRGKLEAHGGTTGCVWQLAMAWKRVLQYQAEDATVYGEVVSVNRGGLLVDVEGLRGFVPLSHVTSVRLPDSPHSTSQDPLPQ
jgi:hypothetical protein